MSTGFSDVRTYKQEKIMWYNSLIVGLLNSPLHSFLSGNMMVITYQGRKSGKTYHTPVNYVRFTDPGGKSELLTASLRQRTWWRNLRGGSMVTLRLAGRNQTATAQVIEDDAGVAIELERLLNAMPNLAKYLGVGRDSEGRLKASDIQNAAQGHVIIKCQF